MRKIKPEVYGSPMEVERREHYPYFDSELKHLPEAKKWKVGEKYYVLLEVKMKRLSVTKSEDGEERGSAGFDITGIEVQKKPKKVIVTYQVKMTSNGLTNRKIHNPAVIRRIENR